MAGEGGSRSFAVPSLPASSIISARSAGQNEDQRDGSDQGSSHHEQQIERPATQEQPLPPVPYTPPDWSATPPPSLKLALEVLKSGTIIGTIVLDKPSFLIGRLPNCDLTLDHASISRYHAVLEFQEGAGLFLWDLGSTHGTFIGKERVKSGQYIKLKTGSVLRFGASTRLFALSGGEVQDDEDEENDGPDQPTVRARRQKRPGAYRDPTAANDPAEITWGFGEDATEDEPDVEFTSLSENDTDKSAYYHANPRKALQTFLQTHSLSLDIHTDESGAGHARVYTSTINLEVPTLGTTIVASGTASRKRESERDACLDACIKLDRRGVLRTDTSTRKDSEAERKRRRDLFGDANETEDSFYDRTSRPAKKSKSGTSSGVSAKAENFESLTKQHESLSDKLSSLKESISQLEEEAKPRDIQDEVEKVMDDMRVKEALSRKAGIEKQIAQIELEIKRVQDLIQLVHPDSVTIHLPKAAANRPSATTPTPSNSRVVPSAITPKQPEPDTEIIEPKPQKNPPADAIRPITEPALRSGPENKISKQQRSPSRPRSPHETTQKPVSIPPKLTYTPLRPAEARMHAEVETEDVVDVMAVPGLNAGDMTEEQVRRMNEAYGY
ncbi:hypothetical protein BC832DRAFT_279591 [Gaertneriomyces semiglobifer]|nr:hypothetical protein BC832DRAFT_279591 [Gaertneriomyces semiglobifer]